MFAVFVFARYCDLDPGLRSKKSPISSYNRRNGALFFCNGISCQL